jgi:Family of unknown function (DUF6090)
MIKFFRKIRQNMIKENRTSKYLLYAIGEIILVVIGILIALSINNWNENRKDKIKERNYLIGIKADLLQDQNSLITLIPKIEIRLNQYKKVDSTTINYSDISSINVPDTLIDPKYFAYPIQSFRPKFGTYNSFLSEGKTGLVTNRILFDKIQGIYEVDNAKIKDANIYTDAKSKEIMWEYRDFLLYDVLNVNPSDIKNAEFIASLNYLQNDIARYVRLLKRLRANINNVNKLINDELEKK